MQALTVAGGTVRLDDVPEPAAAEGSILAEAVALGVCGTDREIVEGAFGQPPPGAERLIIGHESLGRVLEAPAGSGFGAGDLVVGIVRRPDPEPCPFCAAGEPDLCSNGRFTEHGISARHGFGSERWRIEPAYAVPGPPSLGVLGVLLEPASIVAKAWEQVERIDRRLPVPRPGRRALVLGAGPIGLLAALGAVQRGFAVEVVDRVAAGRKPALVQALGAVPKTSVDDLEGAFDVILEASGAPALAVPALHRLAPLGVAVVIGMPGPHARGELGAPAFLRELVLGNRLVLGVMNSNRRHFEQAARMLERAERSWLEGLLTSRLPLAEAVSAFASRPDDIKTIVEFGPAG